MATHGEPKYIPSIVLGELHFGFMKGDRRQINERKLKQFIDRLKVEIIGIDTDVSGKFATIHFSLRKKAYE